MEIKAKCPSCKFEFTLKPEAGPLRECPICKYSIQTESKMGTKRVLTDVYIPKKGLLND